MKGVPEVLDKMADVVLAYRPKPKTRIAYAIWVRIPEQLDDLLPEVINAPARDIKEVHSLTAEELEHHKLAFELTCPHPWYIKKTRIKNKEQALCTS